MSLFDDPANEDLAVNAAGTPLAERMRPATFDEFIGQEDILAPGRPLREAIERDLLQSSFCGVHRAQERPRWRG